MSDFFFVCKIQFRQTVPRLNILPLAVLKQTILEHLSQYRRIAPSVFSVQARLWNLTIVTADHKMTLKCSHLSICSNAAVEAFVEPSVESLAVQQLLTISAILGWRRL